MPRTDSDAVEGICDVIAGTDLTPYIIAANELVTEVCEPKLDADGNAYYTSTRLELIERWLAAHFYCVFDPRAQSESAGVSASYEGQAAMYLERTRYGQMAMILDTAGGLAALNKAIESGKNQRISVNWLGVTPVRAREIQIEDDAEEVD